MRQQAAVAHFKNPPNQLIPPADAPEPAAEEVRHAGELFDARAARAIVERLRGARKPLVLCGPAAATKTGGARLRALEEALGIPAIAMESPRGINDPSLGAFASILRESDRVLLLGKRLDFTLKFGRPPAFAPACEFLQLENGATYDYLSAIDGLAHAARDAAAPRSGWRDEVRSALAYRPRDWDTIAATPMHPVQALRPLQALLDAHPDSVLVCDGGEFGQWAQACLSAPNRVINGAAVQAGVVRSVF